MTVQLARQHSVNTEFLIDSWLKGRDRMNHPENAGTQLLIMGQTTLSKASTLWGGEASSAKAFGQSSLLFSLLLLFGQQAT